MTINSSADFTRFCATLQGANLPARVREQVRYLLLDHLAVVLRGSLLPSSEAAYRMLDTYA